MNEAILHDAGIDYAAGLKRFMGDQALYESILLAFLQDNALERAEEAFRAGDRTALLAVAHEIKGAGGSADMTRLYASASKLVTLLRGVVATDGDIAYAYGRFAEAYRMAAEGIRKAQDA